MADLSSILGGMVQGFKDFGTGLVDMFGTGGAAIGDAIASIQSGRATTKNQDDFRKWLYNTDSTKDAAAKGLGTALNGVSTVADVIPGAQAVTANPLFNGIQGAIGGVADELKMAGENADLGRAAQRAGVGAASGLASGYAGQALGKSGNKLLSNGLTRGAVSGALGGGIANAGYTGIEGGSVQDMINAGLYGAQTGALVGGTTGLARELIKPNHKMDVALTDEEKAARIANIDDQLGKLDLSTPEGNTRYSDLMNARNNYANDEMLKLYRGISAPDDATLQRYIDDMKNPDIEPTNYSGGSAYGKGYYFTPDEGIARYYASESGLPSTAVLEIEVPKNRFTEISKANGNRPADFDLAAVKRGVPEDIRYETGLKDFNDYLDNNGYWGSKTSDDGTYTIMRNDAVLNAKRLGDTPKTVADLMLSPDDADIMASAALPGSNKKAKTTNGVNRIGSDNVAPVDESTLPKGWKELQDLIDKKYLDDIPESAGLKGKTISDMTNEQLRQYVLDIQKTPGQRKGWENRIKLMEDMGETPERIRNDLISVAKWGARDKAMDDIEALDIPQSQKNVIYETANKDDEAWKEEKRYINNYAKGAEGKKGWENNVTSEADAEFSDRLGIGQSHTLKQDKVPHDGAAGQYLPGEYTMAIQPYLNKENAVSTLAHERLHSFQFEAPEGRYDKRVIDAYNELSKDLKPFIHDKKTIQSRYKTVGDTEYWARPIEQEARMVQQYLDNKGYTKNAVAEYRKGEWGKEINPAFDKFFNTLRKLSKKGVALPALSALFGGGAIMAATQSDDKKKKSEVK